MKFWDSSAVVPLLVQESHTDTVMSLRANDPVMLVWWTTEVECASAIARLERAADLEADSVTASLARLDALGSTWIEMQPTSTLRTVARRMLRVHDLRAADALQLAAAAVAAEGHLSSLEFVSLDHRLVAAARREGLAITAIE